jgi:hypothetical protein
VVPFALSARLRSRAARMIFAWHAPHRPDRLVSGIGAGQSLQVRAAAVPAAAPLDSWSTMSSPPSSAAIAASISPRVSPSLRGHDPGIAPYFRTLAARIAASRLRTARISAASISSAEKHSGIRRPPHAPTFTTFTTGR